MIAPIKNGRSFQWQTNRISKARATERTIHKPARADTPDRQDSRNRASRNRLSKAAKKAGRNVGTKAKVRNLAVKWQALL
jgi:hypothetical protein